jgi:hypothetical protein
MKQRNENSTVEGDCRPEPWIGLIGLYPLKGNTTLAQNQGAYANILLIASSIEDYKIKAKEFLLEINFEIFEMEDIESLSERIKNFGIDSSISYLTDIVKLEKSPQISTLHVFDREDF